MRNPTNILAVAAVVAAGFIFSSVSPVLAGDDVQALKKQVASLEKRLNTLEAAQAAQAKAAAAPAAPNAIKGSWDPLNEFDRMQAEVNRLFQQGVYNTLSTAPGLFDIRMSFNDNMGLQETKDGYVIKVKLEGPSKDNLKIDVKKHTITVSNQGSSKTDRKRPNGSFESDSYTSFMQAFTLPPDADVNNISTSKKGDTLIIKIPRKA